MTRILILALLTHVLLFSADFTATPKQDVILRLAKTMGAPFDIGEDLMGICLTESTAGVHVRNYRTGCYGVMMTRLISYMSRNDIRDTPENQETAYELLTRQPAISISEAISEYLYWLKYYKGDRQKAKGAYNGGFKWYKKRESIRFVKKVDSNIKLLKKAGY